MSKHSINCKEVMEHICENLGEDLNSDRCLNIKQHLEDCDKCQGYFKSVDTTIKFYKEYNVNLSQDAHSRLLNTLGLED